MQELGELDRRFADFDRRGLRIVVVSVDDQDETAKTQQKFPHLVVLGDPQRQATEAIHAVHAGVGPGGSDIAAPTTLLLDDAGSVRWFLRPDRLIVRLTPDELLAVIDGQR